MGKKKATEPVGPDPAEAEFRQRQAELAATGATAAPADGRLEVNPPPPLEPAFGEGPVTVDPETRRLAMTGPDYDTAMERVANGIDAATGRKSKALPDPNRPRTQYMVVGYLDDGKPGEVLGLHKSSRGAHKYLAQTGALIRRIYATVAIYRVRKLAD